MKSVVVVIGPGQIGQAIARRVGVGKHILLADLRQDNADAAAEVLANAGYEVSVATVDASSGEAVQELVGTATGLGEVTGLIHAAFWLTASKSTSPHSFPSGSLFVPTSITTAPSRTISAVTNLAFPMATSSNSASRHTAGRSLVLE